MPTSAKRSACTFRDQKAWLTNYGALKVIRIVPREKIRLITNKRRPDTNSKECSCHQPLRAYPSTMFVICMGARIFRRDFFEKFVQR